MTKEKSPIEKLIIIAGITCTIILAIIWLTPKGAPTKWRSWQRPAPIAPALSDIDQQKLTQSPEAQTNYPEITNRPIFSQTRKPPPKEQEQEIQKETIPPPQDIDTAKLLGIIQGKRMNSVLIQYQEKTQTLTIGQEINGWKLQTIQNRKAQFTKNSETKTLELPFLQ